MPDVPQSGAPDPLAGRVLGSYKILRKIGEGGMGAVYHAIHTTLDREVAFKVVPQRLVMSRPEFAQRFLVEARAAAQVNHPYIVQVYDAGIIEGVHYIAMEFVRGATLKDILQKRNAPLPLRDSLKIIQQAAKGLRAAARQKIIHRDIKPANIMLAHSGVVKVADFGLAKNLAGNQAITTEGQTIGTPAYMSPEQADAENVDFRADIYALGCTLFEMIAGRRPYEADSAVRFLVAHMKEPIPDPLAFQPGLDPGVRPILNKMMAKAPADRYASYDALIDDLNRLKARLDGVAPEPSEDGDTTPLPGTVPAGGAETPTPATAHADVGGATTPTLAAAPPRRFPVAVLAGVGVLALAILVVLIVLGSSGGKDRALESGTPAPAPAVPGPTAAPDREAEIREILARAQKLEREMRFAEALTVLDRVASVDPDHRGAAEARARIRRAMDASRTAADRDSAYRSYWTAADAGKTRAEISDDPKDWEAVSEAARKAIAQKSTDEAQALERYALARRDLALARKADREGELDRALELALQAASHGAVPDGLDRFTAELREKKGRAKEGAERKRRFDELAAKAREAEKGGQEPDLEAALGSWRQALETADAEADRNQAQAAQTRIERELTFRRGMARGEKAEAEGRWEEAVAAYEEALKAKIGDERASEEIARARARIQETLARQREARESGERLRRCEEFSRQAEEAEKPKDRGKTADPDAALALWRKAREAADDPETAKTIDGRIEALRGPVSRKALNDARAAEARKDWVGADRALARALDARPDDRAAAAQRARVAEKLAEVLRLVGAFLQLPAEDRDRFGNPVHARGGSMSDPETGLPYEIWLPEPRMEFVLATPGRFKMGSPKTEPGHRPEENPQINMHVARPFYVGKYETARAEWKALMEPPAEGEGGELPAGSVSWHDAQKFAGDLNRKFGAAEDTPPFFALPSETEWEYAARAGSATAYSGFAAEKDLPGAAWFARNAEGRAHPVGKREPNAWGMYDVQGNVWEWCREYISESLARRFADAPDDAKKAGRVLRGGAFDSPAADCRVARRHSLDPGEKQPNVGLRLCLQLYKPETQQQK